MKLAFAREPASASLDEVPETPTELAHELERLSRVARGASLGRAPLASLGRLPAPGRFSAERSELRLGESGELTVQRVLEWNCIC